MAEDTPVSSALTAEEYVTERQMSKLPVLLVEGDTDDAFFQLARDELLFGDSITISSTSAERLRNVQIDTPTLILSPEDQKLGNREKVEMVCSIAESVIDPNKLVGFVDREFREFHVWPEVLDALGMDHKVGRVRWSRGHSIENTVFEFRYMRPALRDLGVSGAYDVTEALNLTEANFDRVLTLAGALTLAARSTSTLTWLHRTLATEHFRFVADRIEFDDAAWVNDLRRRHGVDQMRANALKEEFVHGRATVEQSSLDSVRWMCHGHLGERAIWTSFLAATTEVWKRRAVPPDKQKLPACALRDRFIRYVVGWLRITMMRGEINSPLTCFLDLGVSL